MSPIKDEMIGGKYDLKKRTFVSILTLALHRDPKVWGPNPDKFDPENFSREAEGKRPPNAWKPFGNGARACIGRGFAMHEAALALGLILQRFKLIDHKRYQLVLKETLTIKPDGFKIKVRPRGEADRTRITAAGATPAAALGGLTPARERPGHNTRLAIYYGSNLGTAEELANRVADLASASGFDVKLAPLDDAVDQLPTEGGVLIFCASYNGAPPDNAAGFVSWLNGNLPPDALAGVRYAVFGCGNKDWSATYQAVPRQIDERLTAHGARRVYVRGEGDAREDLAGEFETWFEKLRPIAAKELGVETDAFANEATAEPLYRIEPIAPSTTLAPPAAAGALKLKIAVNDELQRSEGPEASDRSTRHIEVELPDGRDLSRRRPSCGRAAQCARSGRRNRAPLRLSAQRSHKVERACRTPSAAAYGRTDRGRSIAHRIRRVAANGDPPADPSDGGGDALPRDQAETAGLCRRGRGGGRALPHRNSRQAQVRL